MNAVTIRAIEAAGRQINPERVLHDTTIAYIQSLLQPYAEAIEQATTIDSIRDWIPRAFPGQLADHAIFQLTKIAPTGDLEAVKVAVIKYILDEIVELGGNVTRDNNDVNILPWDVQKAIGFDEELSSMFGIRNDPQTLRNGEPQLLPVTINGYTHYLSQDFVAGLLLFSQSTGFDFVVIMFGVPFYYNYVNRNNRYTSRKPSEYTVIVFNHDFNFNSPEFMQGFATGAQWGDVDHHKYWRDLMQYTETGGAIPITF